MGNTPSTAHTDGRRDGNLSSRDMNDENDPGTTTPQGNSNSSDTKTSNTPASASSGPDGPEKGTTSPKAAPDSAASGSNKPSLDERTLERLKGRLEPLRDDYTVEQLDEEDVVHVSIKIARRANDRSKYRHEHKRYKHTGEVETVPDVANTSNPQWVYDMTYRQEEEQLLKDDFWKQLVGTVQDEDPSRDLDSRTLKWLKKASGIIRPPADPLDDPFNHESFLQSLYNSDDDDTDGGGGTGTDGEDSVKKAATKTRRLTRGATRATRVKRLEEIRKQEMAGLEDLMGSIKTLEKDRGTPFESKRFNQVMENDSNSSEEEEDDTDDDRRGSHRETSHMKRQYNRRHEPVSPPRPGESVIDRKRRKAREYYHNHVRRVSEPDDPEDYQEQPSKKPRVSQVGQHDANGISRMTLKLFAQRFPFYGNLSIPGGAEDVGKHNDPVVQQLLKWQRDTFFKKGKESKAEDPMPLGLRQAGFELSLPDKEVIRRAVVASARQPNNHPSSYCSSSAQHPSGSQSSNWARQLFTSLSDVGVRRWAAREFFYSDIDRAWYGRNDFVSQLVELGISPDAKLTRHELSKVRRKMRGRPKLFSKRFILRELQKRNEFRTRVRQLQRDPNLPNNLGCSRPKVLPCGTAVTAKLYNAQTLARGRVLLYDSIGHRYLIQFEDLQYGKEFCSDTDVAKYVDPGPIPAESTCRHTDSLATQKYFRELFVPPFSNIPVSRRQLLDDIRDWMNSHNNIDPVSSKLSLSTILAVEKSIHREVLVTLMETIETNTHRKSLLLDAVDVYTTVNAPSLPFGDECFCRSTEQNNNMTEHYAWLLANLEIVQQTLSRAHQLLRVMYRCLYEKPPETDPHEDTLYTLVDNIRCAVDRKTALLRAQEMFNDLPERPTRLQQGQFAWVRANLEVTDNYLTRAHAMLRAIYGPLYLSGSTSVDPDLSENLEDRTQQEVVDVAGLLVDSNATGRLGINTAVERSTTAFLLNAHFSNESMAVPTEGHQKESRSNSSFRDFEHSLQQSSNQEAELLNHAISERDLAVSQLREAMTMARQR